jgi:hypothetical protein
MSSHKPPLVNIPAVVQLDGIWVDYLQAGRKDQAGQVQAPQKMEEWR